MKVIYRIRLLSVQMQQVSSLCPGINKVLPMCRLSERCTRGNTDMARSKPGHNQQRSLYTRDTKEEKRRNCLLQSYNGHALVSRLEDEFNAAAEFSVREPHTLATGQIMKRDVTTVSRRRPDTTRTACSFFYSKIQFVHLSAAAVGTKK